MGIRLHKKLGWALTGLEHDQRTGVLTDPRVNADVLHSHAEADQVGGHYLAYLEALRDAEDEQSDTWFDLMMSIEMVKETRSREGRLDWPVTRRSDAGRRDVLLIQPVGFPHWSRYGDHIDQLEEQALHPGTEPRVVPMPYGIYPFEGLYMDSRDGRRLDSTAKRLLDRLRGLADEDGSKAAIRQKTAQHLATMLGFDDPEQARQHIAPVVPPDVRYVVSWLNLFNGPDVWLQLRPMLYVYWS